MPIGRTILAFLVALSVAMLPMTGGFALQKNDVTASEVVVASAHDCCDDEGMPVDHMMKDCHAAAGCASKCFSLYDAMLSSPIIHPSVTGAELSFAIKIFRPQDGNLPFRPPRV